MNDLLQKKHAKPFLAAALLSLLGYFGNMLALPMAYSVSFIFGSIFSIIALQRLGLWWGISVALAASSYTFFLWNHPYAIIIFTAEILWIGLALRRGRTNILMIDSIYWVVLGMPLVVLFYAGAMHMGVYMTTIVALKQSLNGILNALIAGIVLGHTRVGRGKAFGRKPLSYSNGLFHLVATFLIVPSLGLLLLSNYQEMSNVQDRIALEVSSEARESEAMVALWIKQHVNAAKVIGELGSNGQLVPAGYLQDELRRVNYLFPDFHNVFLGNADATTVAFHPAVNERGESTIGINFADRAWFKDLNRTLQPVVSDIFMGRGGIFEPIFSISYPIVKEGKLSHFGLGAINLARMQELFKRAGERKDIICTVIDRNNNVVVSTHADRKPLDRFEDTASTYKQVTADVSLRLPGVRKNISFMESWKGASYYSKLPIRGTTWTLLVEYPVAPLQKDFYRAAILSLGVVSLLFALMISIASYVTRRFTQPLRELALVSKNLPERVDRNEVIDWPEPSTLELAYLKKNFSQTAEELYKRIFQVREANRQLEQRVEDRTSELKIQQQRLADIIHGTNVGTWEWNVQTGELIINQRWAEIIGYELSELEPVSIQTWRDYAHPDDLKSAEAHLERHFSGESDSYVVEIRMKHKDDRWVWVLTRGMVHSWTADGNPLLMSGTHLDISGTKEQEVELRRAKSQAESANLSKGEFLANMSHEIRTPINGIIGMSQLLEMTDLTEEQSEFVEALMASGKGLLSLVNDILDLSKIDAGKVRIETAEFSLKHSINHVVLSQKALIHDKGLSLEIDIAGDIPHVLVGDPLRVQQILLNLLSNAVKFTAQGGISISAQVVEQHDRSVIVKILVRDTGSGIKAEGLKNIFNPFVQEDSSITRQFGGTGLGLTISRHLAELMDGSISVESTPGVGSCFEVTLPFNINQKIGNASVHLPKETINWDGPSLRILFVEDNPINIKFGSTLLKKLGHDVTVAENGRVSLSLLGTEIFDLVLMDIQMPVMDGFEATRAIRNPQSDVLNHQVPIVAMTAYAMQGDREKCLDSGMNDYLSKPLTPQALMEMLSKWSPVESIEGTATSDSVGHDAKDVPSASGASSSAVFNREEMLDRLMGDELLARTFTSDFLASLPRHFDELRSYLEAGDAQGVARQAHGLKGVSAIVGGEVVRDVAFEMEQAALTGDLNAASGYMAELEEQADQLRAAIQEQIQI